MYFHVFIFIYSIVRYRNDANRPPSRGDKASSNVKGGAMGVEEQARRKGLLQSHRQRQGLPEPAQPLQLQGHRASPEADVLSSSSSESEDSSDASDRWVQSTEYRGQGTGCFSITPHSLSWDCLVHFSPSFLPFSPRYIVSYHTILSS
jgi:hypothetical protein